MEQSSGLPAAPADRPGLWRRLACFVYEGVLLFGVVMISGYLYSSLTQQRHALQGQHGLQAFLFLILGLYFIWFWSHGGQTVAMKTWHLRLQRQGGGAVSQPRALGRYLLSWVWFLPALAWTAASDGTPSGGAIAGGLVLGVAVYALLALLHPRRQFWHDALCGTELVTARPAPRRRRAKVAEAR